MKFYEINEPYYALLKANSEKEAIRKYVHNVADLEEEEVDFEIKEVSRDYALARFSRAPGEDKKLLPIGQIVSDFNVQEIEVMIIDGSLI